MVLAAATLWGSSGLFINLIAETGLTGSQITALRLVMVPIMVLVFLLITDRSKLRIQRKDLGWMVLNGIIGIFVFNLCYTYAIQWTGMATAAVLLYLMPSLVMLFSVLFLGERFTLRKGLCLALSLLGCGLVSGLADGFTANLPGLALGLLAAVCYTFYNILVATRLKRYSSFTNVLYPFAFAAVCCWLYVLLRGEIPGILAIAASDIRCLPLCAALALCCSVLSYWLYNSAVKRIPPSRASIIATFEPVAAALLGLVFLHQKLSVFAVVGICCELLALVLLNLPEKRR